MGCPISGKRRRQHGQQQQRSQQAVTQTANSGSRRHWQQHRQLAAGTKQQALTQTANSDSNSSRRQHRQLAASTTAAGDSTGNWQRRRWGRGQQRRLWRRRQPALFCSTLQKLSLNSEHSQYISTHTVANVIHLPCNY